LAGPALDETVAAASPFSSSNTLGALLSSNNQRRVTDKGRVTIPRPSPAKPAPPAHWPLYDGNPKTRLFTEERLLWAMAQRSGHRSPSDDIRPTDEAILFRVLKLSVKSRNDNLPRRHWFDPGLRRPATAEGRAVESNESKKGEPAERGSSSTARDDRVRGAGWHAGPAELTSPPDLDTATAGGLVK